MKSKNNKGPKIEHWGTPDNTLILSDETLSRTTLCFLPWR